MAYTYQTLATLKTQLSERLSDPLKIHWVDAELGLYLTESMRTFGVMSAFWRERGTVALTSGTAFYDITSTLSGSLVTPTVTDRDIILAIQYALLESTSTQASWPGTDQFTYADVVGAIQRRLNQFLSDTGIILSRTTQVATLTSRQTLDDRTIDVRRGAWIGASPLSYYNKLEREDEFSISAGNPSWTTQQGTPSVYSVMAPPPLTLTLSPTPITTGTLELIVVQTGTALTPAALATVLGIPDDLTPAIKWGALADLLGKDGPAFDPIRAAFCEKRYQQYVQLARLLPCVVNAELNGVSILPEQLSNLDEGAHNWQNSSGPPSYVATVGWNLVAVYPVPNGSYSMTLDVVRNAVIPATDATDIQIGREQLDMILDYAQHLASFKSGGVELDATMRQADNFLVQCITYNQRLSAAAAYIITPKETSQRNKRFTPRRENAEGLGSQPSQTESPSFVKQSTPVRMN